jgi:hypothetical protein
VPDQPFHLAYGDGTVLNGHRFALRRCPALSSPTHWQWGGRRRTGWLRRAEQVRGGDILQLARLPGRQRNPRFRHPRTRQVTHPCHLNPATPDADAGSLGSQPEPLPLLFVLTGGIIDHVPPVEPGSNLLPVRAFSFHAKENAAELQLGGYDAVRASVSFSLKPLLRNAVEQAAVIGTMHVFPTVMPTQCVQPRPLAPQIKTVTIKAGTWRPRAACALAARSSSAGRTRTSRARQPSFPRCWTQAPPASSSRTPCRSASTRKLRCLCFVPGSVGCSSRAAPQDGTFSISPYQLWLSIVKDTVNPQVRGVGFVVVLWA